MITYEKPCSIVQQLDNLGEPVAQDTDHILKRKHPFEYQKGRPTYWYSPINKMMILPDGTKGTVPTNTPSLTHLLDYIAKRTIKEHQKQVANLYLVAGKVNKTRPRREWFDVIHANGLDEKLQWKQARRPFWKRLQYKYERDGFTVYLYGTCNHFGDETDLDAMYEALNTLEPKLERKFNAEGYKLLGDTPAQTGRELLEISLPKGKQYPHLIGAPAEIVYHNLRYQGRVETLPQKRERLENGVYVLDARFMYASCLSHLPIGPVYHDKRNEFLGKKLESGKWYPMCPGFYNVTVQAPDNWHHIGLIKSGKSKSPVDDRGYYPNEPGVMFSNWITAAELALLLNNNWPVYINERIIWPETEKTTDPLAVWIRSLRELRKEIEEKLKSNPDDKILALHKAMIRDIVLKATGSFHQYMTYEDYFTPNSELPLKSQFEILVLGTTTKGIKWREIRPLSEKRQKWIHPEWSATAWGRARARLATFALRLPYEDIVNFRTDCVLCANKPDWLESEDTGIPGCFREKAHIQTPWHWPKNITEVDAYIAKYGLELEDDNFSDIEE